MPGVFGHYYFPSYQDFARTAQESYFPELWDGRVIDLVPALGKTGWKIPDISGNNNDGTLTNMDNDGDWVVDTEQGYGLDFVGASNDQIQCGSPASLDDLPALTVVQWIYVRTLVDNRIFFGKTDTGSNNGWKYGTSGTSGQWFFYVDCDGTDLSITFTTPLIVVNEWACMAVTYPGGLTATNVKGYKNGVECSVASSTNGTTARTSDASRTVVIGNLTSSTNAASDFICGRTMLYNRVLSQWEICALADIQYLDLMPIVGNPAAFVAAAAATKPWWYYEMMRRRRGAT